MFALILGMPTLKLRGDYLAIVTISAAEIIRFTGRLSILTDFTGAAQGIPGKEYRDPFSDLSFFGDGATGIGPLGLQQHRRQRLVGALRRLDPRGHLRR